VGTGGCASGGCASGGCATCGDCGCESGGGLFSRLKGRFHRGGGDCGCGCETSRFGGHLHSSDSGCASCGSTCDTCGSGHGGGLRERLHGLFHRGGGDCGCDTGCGSCGGCAGGGCGGVLSPVPGGTIMPKAEPIGPPKGADDRQKLPPGDKGTDKKSGSVQLIPQPISVPSLQITPTGGKSPF
jgi:hypothetical protein